jgi:F-type H+-transporting ATPase subunit a
MMAGHLVIGAFIALILMFGIAMAPPSIVFALFIHFLELLVAFLQAYIFTVLTSQFIALSVHPAH